MTTTARFATMSVAAAALVMTACSSPKPPSPDPVTAPPAPPTQLFSDDFHGVCDGAGVSRATAYTPTAPTHKVILFSPYTGSVIEDTSTLPTDWMVQFDANTDAYAKVDTVACIQLKNEQPLKECTGYQDNGHDTSNKVDLRTATYTVTVHEATTGKVLGTTDLAGTDDSCPMFMTFDDDTQSKTYDSPPSKDDVIAILEPFVQPEPSG